MNLWPLHIKSKDLAIVEELNIPLSSQFRGLCEVELVREYLPILLKFCWLAIYKPVLYLTFS